MSLFDRLIVAHTTSYSVSVVTTVHCVSKEADCSYRTCICALVERSSWRQKTRVHRLPRGVRCCVIRSSVYMQYWCAKDIQGEPKNGTTL